MDRSDGRRVVLNENNYVTWVTLMEAELRQLGCWNYVIGVDNVVTEEKKEKMYCLLMRCLDEGIVAFVGNKITIDERGDGRALWNILKDKFVGSATTRKMELTVEC